MKVSIITAVYNAEKTIGNTIESILDQTYANIEYIIIDGGSKDKTIDIIKEFEPKFQGKLRWISERDKGIYDAMNKGIRMATGDIIGILNSDDFFTSDDVISTVNETFEKYNPDAIYGDIHFVNDDNLNKIVRYYSSRIFRRGLMRFGFMPAHPSFYIKRECFDKFGLYNTSYKIAADFEFLLRTIFIGNIKTQYVAKDFVTMRTGGASTSGINSHKQIMREHIRAFKENNIFTNRLLLSMRYIYTNRLLLSMRYIYKIFEIILSKIKY